MLNRICEKKPTILLLANTCRVGGAEMHLLSLAKHLNKTKYDLTFAFFNQQPADARSLKRDFINCGIKVVDLRAKSKFDVFAILRLIKLIRDEKFDIVHTHLYYSDVIGALVARAGINPILISTIHSRDENLKKPVLRLLARVAGKLANQIIVISDAVGHYFTKAVGVKPNKIRRIYYGLEIPNRSSIKQDIRNEYDINNAPLIGMIGRYAPVKGHRFLLEAMVKVLERFPNARLFLAGHDYENVRNNLEEYAKNLGIIKNVIFSGFRSDVLDLNQQFDIFVLSSLSEGFGLVLLEAMSIGNPIVATCVGAIPEIVVDGKTGFLVPPKDPEAMADKIILLLENKTLAKEIGEAGRKRWKQLFTMDKIIKATEEVYDYWLAQKQYGTL